MSRDTVVSMSRPAYAAPPSPHRFTREEYHRMAGAGLFANERVELLDGTIVTMSPHTTHHAATISRLYRILDRTLRDKVCLRPQLSVVLNDWSEPEPDVAVCKPDTRDYVDEHPHPEDVLVVCEVSLSSLPYDRTHKAAAYSASGIPEYWIVDVESRVIHVLRDPDRSGRRYTREETRGESDDVTAPDGTRIAVAEILPPR